jgi:hypothetical protein
VLAVKGVLIAVATAALVLGAFYLLNESNQPGGVPPGEAPAQAPTAAQAPEAEAGSARDRLLRSTAQQNGVTPMRGVWGVVMERGYAKGVATVIALADGTASLYIPTGASVLGGRTYPPAHEAAQRMCERAADLLGETAATQAFPPPDKGHMRLYVLTADGVRVAERDMLAAARDGGRDALAPLVAAGDAVLDALKDGTSKGLIR